MDKFGIGTFSRPALHSALQKPLDPKTVDHNIDNVFLGSNGHMTLQVYIDTPGGSMLGVKSERKK